MKKIILSLFCILNFSVIAQQWLWDSIVTSTNDIRIVNNHGDDVFTFGHAETELKKYNSNGKLVWVKSFGGTINNVNFDLADNIYIVGTFSNTLVLDSFTLMSKGDLDIFLLKLNPTGDAIWLKQIGSNSSDIAGDICVHNNNIYVTGAVKDTTFISQTIFPKTVGVDMFISMFDINGNIQQMKFADRMPLDLYSISVGQEIKQDGLGNLILLATISGTIKIDTSTVKTMPYSRYVLKFDSSLNLLWEKYIGSGIYEFIHNLQINSVGDIFLIETRSSHYLNYGAIKKISSDGFLLQNFFIEDRGYINGMDIDLSDNIYFTGIHRKWTFSGNPPPEDFFKTGKVDSSGNLMWIIQDSSIYHREGQGIAALSNNTCFVSGVFDNQIALHNTFIGMPGIHYFLAILDAGNTTTINEMKNGGNYADVYPNPSAGIFTVNLKIKNIDLKICVYDVLGNCLLNKDYHNDAIPKIDLSCHAKGFYFLEIISDRERVMKKVILE